MTHLLGIRFHCGNNINGDVIKSDESWRFKLLFTFNVRHILCWRYTVDKNAIKILNPSSSTISTRIVVYVGIYLNIQGSLYIFFSHDDRRISLLYASSIIKCPYVTSNYLALIYTRGKKKQEKIIRDRARENEAGDDYSSGENHLARIIMMDYTIRDRRDNERARRTRNSSRQFFGAPFGSRSRKGTAIDSGSNLIRPNFNRHTQSFNRSSREFRLQFQLRFSDFSVLT